MLTPVDIKLTYPNYITEVDLQFDLQKQTMDLHLKIRDQQNDILEASVRNNSTPPIKGKLTKGKLRWRGIKLIMDNTNLFSHRMYLMQRDKQISPIIETCYIINYNDIDKVF